jgi:hypothetical protein
VALAGIAPLMGFRSRQAFLCAASILGSLHAWDLASVTCACKQWPGISTLRAHAQTNWHLI